MLIISFNIMSMEENNNNITDIFEGLDTSFVGPMHTEFIKSVLGRNILMHHRASEFFIAEDAYRENPNKIYITTGNLYDNNIAALRYDTNAKITTMEKRYLHIFAQGIAAIEKALLLKDIQTDKFIAKQFEKTRILDLYLLKKVLEDHNNPETVAQASPYTVIDYFINTDEWPPAHIKDFVHPTSGYQVVQEALEYRKKNNVDAHEEEIIEILKIERIDKEQDE